ncbi:hypothetical protein D3C72_575980 [compost metagenome]
MMLTLIGCNDEMALVFFFYINNFFFKSDIRVKMFDLLIQVIHELLSRNFREAGNIINIFLRIERGKLPAKLRHTFDQFHGCLTHSAVKSSKHSRRTTADDKQIREIAALIKV